MNLSTRTVRGIGVAIVISFLVAGAAFGAAALAGPSAPDGSPVVNVAAPTDGGDEAGTPEPTETPEANETPEPTETPDAQETPDADQTGDVEDQVEDENQIEDEEEAAETPEAQETPEADETPDADEDGGSGGGSDD